MGERYLDSVTGNSVRVHGRGGGAGTFASAKSSGAVTPSDATVLDFHALYVGGTGTVSIDHTEGGTAVAYTLVPAGTILPISGVRVNAATTASAIVWMRW